MYECVRPARGWSVPDDFTLFLVRRGKWLAIHARRNSSQEEVLAMQVDNIAFASDEDILQPGEHHWQAATCLG